MAHDKFNTHGGEFGFSVDFADGTSVTERQVTWDEVPADKPIAAVAISRLGLGVNYFRLKGYRQFFFHNEGVSSRGGGVIEHSAKILGGVREDGTIDEVALLFTREGPKKAEPKKYAMAQFRFLEKSLRMGASSV